MSRLLLTAILAFVVVCATPSSRVDARAQAQAPRAAAPQVQAAAPKSTLPNDSDSVKFKLISPLRPAVLEGESDDYVYLIMPIRLAG